MNNLAKQYIAEFEAHEAKLATVKLKLKKDKSYSLAGHTVYFVEYQGNQIARARKLTDDSQTYWQIFVWDEDGNPWALSPMDLRRQAIDSLKQLILEGDNFELVQSVRSGWQYTGLGRFRDVSVKRHY
tara:strand:- start:623 stop:1006 length:384 start_codon:yes stop_codon:yes gene_type:complete